MNEMQAIILFVLTLLGLVELFKGMKDDVHIKNSAAIRFIIVILLINLVLLLNV